LDNEKIKNVQFSNNVFIENSILNSENKYDIGFVVSKKNSDIIKSIINNDIFKGKKINPIIFENDESLEKFYKSNPCSLIAGIIIDPDMMVYTLRIDGSSIPDPFIENNNNNISSSVKKSEKKLKINISNIFSKNSDFLMEQDIYSLSRNYNSTSYISVFIPLQIAVEEALIKYNLNITLNNTYNIGKLPYSISTNNFSISYKELLFIVLTELIFNFSMYFIMKYILSENENNIKELLLFYGINPLSNLISWFISHMFFIYSLIFIECIIYLIFESFSMKSVLMLFILKIIYSTSIFNIFMGYCSFFKSSKIGFTVNELFFPLISFIYILFYFLPKELNIYGSILFSPVTMGNALEHLLLMEKRNNLNYNIFKDSNMQKYILMMLWNNFLYFIIVLFIETSNIRNIKKIFTLKNNLKEDEEGSLFIQEKKQKNMEKNSGEQKNFIEIKNINKEYSVEDKKILALNNISFKIYKNEIFCLLGHNGAGKSSSIKIMTGLLKADNGEVIYDGKEFTENQNDIIKNMGKNIFYF